MVKKKINPWILAILILVSANLILSLYNLEFFDSGTIDQSSPPGIGIVVTVAKFQYCDSLKDSCDDMWEECTNCLDDCTNNPIANDCLLICGSDFCNPSNICLDGYYKDGCGIFDN